MGSVESSVRRASSGRGAFKRDGPPGAADRSTAQERIAYLARGNTLLVNQGGKLFHERSAQAGVINTQWTWGTLFGDFDNSGGLDMMAMNGFITGPVVDDL